jgi:serine/threonine protein kinase
VPEPAVSSPDTELRSRVERALASLYEIDCELGRGGMGIVYRGRDKRLKRMVAIKILPPELAFRGEIRSRFLREAETAAQLNHANIVDIYTVDETVPTPDDPSATRFVYFVMAYIRGDNLARRVHERGPLEPGEAWRILREVTDALSYAHARGVIHRDIKPDNIVLDADNLRPMVTDFGLARAISDSESRLTISGMAMGTPTYMSPEQASGDREIDGRSDLYSLGVVAYQMLTGRPPFAAKSVPAMLVKHLSEAPTPVTQLRPDVPRDLARVVMTLLEKAPDDRFASAEALAAALDEVRIPASVRTLTRTTRPEPVAAAGRARRDAALGPTPAEMERWHSEPVRKFRGKAAPYFFVNSVIVVYSVFTGGGPIWWTVAHSVYMAIQYVKLRDTGHDWRDVFRQTRDRELIDVVDDTMAYARTIFDAEHRARRRRERARRAAARRADEGGAETAADEPLPPAQRSEHADRLKRALADRDEIIRLLDAMDTSARVRLADVANATMLLAGRMQSLTAALVDLDGRQEPAAESHRVALAANLDSCGSLLESMKFGLRLTGSRHGHEHVASLAGQAASLSASADGALEALAGLDRPDAGPAGNVAK